MDAVAIRAPVGVGLRALGAPRAASPRRVRSRAPSRRTCSGRCPTEPVSVASPSKGGDHQWQRAHQVRREPRPWSWRSSSASRTRPRSKFAGSAGRRGRACSSGWEVSIPGLRGCWTRSGSGAALRRSRSRTAVCGRRPWRRSPAIEGNAARALPRRPPVRRPGRLAAPARRELETTQITSLAYDGLVAYRRAAGTAGATLVARWPRTSPTQPRRADLRLHAPPRAALLGRPARPAGDSAHRSSASCGDAQGAVVSPYYEGIVGASGA